MSSDEVSALVLAGHVLEAAGLARTRGETARASDLFERACAFDEAARCALGAKDLARAAKLARLGGDPATRAAVVREASVDRSLARRLAREARDRGDSLGAALFFEAAGEPALAAAAHERAGEPLRAASLLEEAGDLAGAARVLSSAFSRKEGAVGLALGALLLRAGDPAAALRVLQQLPEGHATRGDALPLLRTAASRLGLTFAAAALETELATHARDARSPPATDAPAPPQAPAEGRLFGRYDVVREVASSATARVLECLDLRTQTRVAVKLFAGEALAGAGRDARARFAREALVLSALHHPGIVHPLPLADEGTERGSPLALVLPWMPGGTLTTLLAATPLSPARAAEITCALLDALGHAHRHGVLHRDVKPSNVLFDAEGAPRLADFGAAHVGALGATVTASMVGTLAYMSPEQREGRQATVQSDLYAAGRVFEEMLAPSRESGSDEALEGRKAALLSSLTATNPSERPLDAATAIGLIRALPWSSEPPPARAEASPPPARAMPRVPAPGFDAWLKRPFETAPLNEETLARAGAFARAPPGSALQRVLRVDRASGTLWLSPAPSARAVLPLTEFHTEALKGALAELHRAGGAHGSVDGAHLRVTAEGALLLAFPGGHERTLDLGAARAGDWSAFEALTRH